MSGVENHHDKADDTLRGLRWSSLKVLSNQTKTNK